MAKEEEPQSWANPPTATEKAEKPPFGNIWRIFGYGSKMDIFLVVVAVLCAAGAGVVSASCQSGCPSLL
jgi:hypothetical protein